MCHPLWDLLLLRSGTAKDRGTLLYSQASPHEKVEQPAKTTLSHCSYTPGPPLQTISISGPSPGWPWSAPFFGNTSRNSYRAVMSHQTTKNVLKLENIKSSDLSRNASTSYEHEWLITLTGSGSGEKTASPSTTHPGVGCGVSTPSNCFGDQRSSESEGAQALFASQTLTYNYVTSLSGVIMEPNHAFLWLKPKYA